MVSPRRWRSSAEASRRGTWNRSFAASAGPTRAGSTAVVPMPGVMPSSLKKLKRSLVSREATLTSAQPQRCPRRPRRSVDRGGHGDSRIRQRDGGLRRVSRAGTFATRIALAATDGLGFVSVVLP